MTATVQAGGRIEVIVPELIEGQKVEVIVEPVPERRLSIDEILSRTPGRQIFKTVEEVDTYINELRDEWD